MLQPLPLRPVAKARPLLSLLPLFRSTRTLTSRATKIVARRPILLAPSHSRPFNLKQCRRAFIIKSRPPSTSSSLNDLNVQTLLKKQQRHQQSRLAFLSAALLASMIWAGVTAYRLYTTLQDDRAKAIEQVSQEANRGAKPGGVGGDSFSGPSATVDLSGQVKGTGSAKIQADALPDKHVPAGSKVVVHNLNGIELVPTGNKTVPHFPRTIQLPGPSLNEKILGQDQVEYTLAGLGIRTVSFLQFSVYVVGLYVATQDIPGIKERVVKKLDSLDSTSLVPSERVGLKARLDDPNPGGEDIWTEALFPARTALRIVPVRDTNFPHLRDGFVRAISHRRDPEATADDAFGTHMRDFKHAFTKGKLSQASELLLQRDGGGRLGISYIDAKGSGRRVTLAEIDEPRLSKLLWLNYLTGAVASPPARESIVQGVIGFVEGPVGGATR